MSVMHDQMDESVYPRTERRIQIQELQTELSVSNLNEIHLTLDRLIYWSKQHQEIIEKITDIECEDSDRILLSESQRNIKFYSNRFIELSYN